ncbi:hypothetical protein [Terracoccus luteus]|uniref:Fibronectin type-III domain-containing protein n=1 Tax=Terracoccus luteus TaxID=53356 RepID=A0A839PW38_9MICO|nr:hypothetical protein [Terracoccus luteus]MBB2988458.1 hypothetical protein [Terracoccus luteus]MCP2174087.1 hypothetical protein [Terracoccus luteus]
MDRFDANEYRKTVMARLHADFSPADPDNGDIFFICALDPRADTATAIQRLADVVAAWQRDRNHPKYKRITGDLVKLRPQYEAILSDPDRRAAARARIEGDRAASDTAALTKLDEYAAPLLKRHSGIPRSKVDALAAFAQHDGLPDAAFKTWLAGHTVIDDTTGAGAAPWDSPVRHQVRTQLDALARSDDPENASRYRTLFTFLGVSPKASPAEIRAAHARHTELNRSRVRGPEMTQTEDLLTHVATRLLGEDGVARYLASLRADARDSLKDDLRRRSLLSGSLPASDLEGIAAGLVALGWGFTAGTARDIVREAAHDARLAVEVGKDIDLIVCADCHRAQAAGQKKRCQYCRAELYQDCPSCNTRVMAAAEVCDHCNANLTVWRKAQQIVEAVETLMSLGKPVTALELCQQVLLETDIATAPAALRAAIDGAQDVIGRAQQMWGDLTRDRARGALWAASVTATWLARNASDVPNPSATSTSAGDRGGQGSTGSIEEILEEIERDKASVLAQVAATETMAPDEAESALTRLTVTYPDCPDATAHLAALPLAAPTAVTAHQDGDAVEISWVPSGSLSRTIRYRVERHTTWPARHVDHATVGATSVTHLEDGAAPIGTLVRYTVTATDGTRSSTPVSTGEPAFIHGDIATLRADLAGTDVTLTWPPAGLGAADVVIERVVDPQSGMTAPTRRIRPTEPGRHVDGPLQYGIPYTYRAHVEYRTPDGENVRTPGVAAAVTLHLPPKPVTEMWARTAAHGPTQISFVSPPSGTVHVYTARTRAELEPVARLVTGTRTELDSASRGLRLVGEGRRRVVDDAATGAVWYLPVTVNGDQVAAGSFLEHHAVRPASDLSVVSDTGGRLTVTFEMPPGVTESYVAWRRDRYPSSATEPVAGDLGGSRRLTNTKLQIDGGVSIDAPDDGRGVYVAVSSGIRAADGTLTPAATAATVLARAVVPVTVSYQVRFGGMLRRHADVDVITSNGRPLPPLTLVAAAGDPAGPDVAATLATHPGGVPGVTLRVEADALPPAPFVLRLFTVPVPGADVTVTDPDVANRSLGW